MSKEELTIEVLQNRIKYLEAHLHLALQVLNEIAKDPQEIDVQIVPQDIEPVTIAKAELPTFLNSRTWKHDVHMANLNNSRDRMIARAS